MTRRLAIDVYRTRIRYPLVALDGSLSSRLIDSWYEGLDLSRELRDAIESIKSTLHREVVLLQYLADLPLSEIAELTKSPINTVKARSARGVADLKRQFANKGG